MNEKFLEFSRNYLNGGIDVKKICGAIESKEYSLEEVITFMTHIIIEVQNKYITNKMEILKLYDFKEAIERAFIKLRD